MSTPIKANTKTKITSFMDAQKAIQELQKNFNLLIDRVVSPAEKDLKETEGNSGEMQVTRNDDKTYTFEVRTEEGWKTPVVGTSAVTFTDKPSTHSKRPNPEPAGPDYSLPRADYDSGWTAAASNTTYTFTHSLNLTDLPHAVEIYTSATNPPVIGTNVIHFGGFQNEHAGTVCEIVDKDVLKVYTGDQTNGLFDTHSFGNPSPSVYASGALRVKIWK